MLWVRVIDSRGDVLVVLYGAPSAASLAEVVASAILCARHRVTVDIDSIDGSLDVPSRRALAAATRHAEARGLQLHLHGPSDEAKPNPRRYRS